jgi:hypothetical protein
MKNSALFFIVVIGLIIESALSNYFEPNMTYTIYYLFSCICYLLVFCAALAFYSISGSKFVLVMGFCALISSILNLFTTFHENFTLIANIRTGYALNWSLTYRLIELTAITKVVISGAHWLIKRYRFSDADRGIRGRGKFDARAM